MTLEERIDVAAREMAVSGNAERWAEISASSKRVYRVEAEGFLRFAFPELFSDPPTAWIAPWHYGPETHRHLLGEHMPVDEAVVAWTAFRDAFLKGEGA